MSPVHMQITIFDKFTHLIVLLGLYTKKKRNCVFRSMDCDDLRFGFCLSLNESIETTRHADNIICFPTK